MQAHRLIRAALAVIAAGLVTAGGADAETPAPEEAPRAADASGSEPGGEAPADRGSDADSEAESGVAGGEHTTHTPISQGTDYEEILVTAAPHKRRRFDVIQGSTVLSKERLERDIQSTIGETLSAQPGISSTYYGPGASRPVIRGLAGPRIRVLQNGIGAIDVSSISPDHAVTVEPLVTSRVEVIRGAATLLYGNSAIGGVVNVNDGRIPDELPGDVAQGDVRVLYGSAATEKAAGAGITAGIGPLALAGTGFIRDTDDLAIPAFAPSRYLLAVDPGMDPGPFGRALDTDVENLGGTLGGALIGDDGMLGASYGVVTSDYGLPTEPDESVRIHLDQRRVDARGEWRGELPLFESAGFKLAWADYEHVELEDGAIGTRFLDEGWEGRIDLVQRPLGDLHGTVGFQLVRRDFAAIGDEAFVPPSETSTYGLFAVEELHLGPWVVEAGLRWDHDNIEAPTVGFARSWNLLSFSLGAAYEFMHDYMAGLSLSRVERAPSPEELLSDGAHLATFGYELGDPWLGKEAGLTVEATLRKRWGRWSAGINVYYTRFSDFIYLVDLGRVDDQGNRDPSGELTLRRYLQSDADFVGSELQAAWEPIQTDRFSAVLDFQFDWVQATADRAVVDTPLPRITPLRIKGGVEGRSEYADLRLEAWWVNTPRLAPGELPTDAYVMLNVIFTAHPFPDRRDVTLVVQGRNLLDQDARVHPSFLKDRLPLAGREARVGLRVAF